MRTAQMGEFGWGAAGMATIQFVFSSADDGEDDLGRTVAVRFLEVVARTIEIPQRS